MIELPIVPFTTSPLLAQYETVKAHYPNAIVFFRMGDFHEAFNDDARRVAKLLGLVLTKRRTAGDPIPMTGIPYHSFHTMMQTLVDAGETVVSCSVKQ